MQLQALKPLLKISIHLSVKSYLPAAKIPPGIITDKHMESPKQESGEI